MKYTVVSELDCTVHGEADSEAEAETKAMAMLDALASAKIEMGSMTCAEPDLDEDAGDEGGSDDK